VCVCVCVCVSVVVDRVYGEITDAGRIKTGLITVLSGLSKHYSVNLVRNLSKCDLGASAFTLRQGFSHLNVTS